MQAYDKISVVCTFTATGTIPLHHKVTRNGFGWLQTLACRNNISIVLHFRRDEFRLLKPNCKIMIIV